ncbi:MAG: hypothetical protein U0R80_05100 [Nocardioidaceae bacterium]
MPDWSRAQWVLRVLVALCPLGATLATGPAGSWPSPVLLVPVGVLAVGAAVAPESLAAAVACCLVLASWALAPVDPLHPMVLVASALLLVTHLAAMLAAAGPGGVTPEAALVRLWVLRGVLVWAPAPVLFAVARGLRGAPEPPYVWVGGLAAVVVALVVTGVQFSRSGVAEETARPTSESQGPRISAF